MRYRLRTLLIAAAVGPPILTVVIYCLLEQDWRLLAGLGLVIAWLVAFCCTNVEAPKPP